MEEKKNMPPIYVVSGGKGVAGIGAPAMDIGSPFHPTIAPGSGRKRSLGTPLTPAGDDIDHAGHGVRAVKGGSRPSDDFDALHIRKEKAGEIETPSRLVHLYAIEENLHMI